MTITDQTTIADIAAAHPASVRVFQRHGVDFCCGGKRPLADVCSEQGLSMAGLLGEIEEAAKTPAAEDRDWTRAPLAALASHIVAVHHQPLREELPRLQAMALKVAGARDRSPPAPGSAGQDRQRRRQRDRRGSPDPGSS